jgi:hypothetical protein
MSGPVTPEPHIVCPRCSYQIPLTGSLAAPLPEAARVVRLTRCSASPEGSARAVAARSLVVR